MKSLGIEEYILQFDYDPKYKSINTKDYFKRKI